MKRTGVLALIIVMLALAGCRKEEKRPMRTEPWPAPALSISAAATPGATVQYSLAGGTVQVELKGKRSRFNGVLSRLDGELDFDAARLEKTRGAVRADLLSLSFPAPGAGGTDESPITLAALRALELTADRPEEERQRDRFALLRITGFEPPGNEGRGTPPGKKAAVSAFAELTLHRFRVPLTLELDVELVPVPGRPAPEIRVRTRRPFVVQLAAHDLRAAPPGDSDVTRGTEPPAREARVSAELSWQPTESPKPPANNP